jgi:hypothetical protein
LLITPLTPEAERDFENNLSISTVPIAENYQLEANRSWTNTGQYFNDYIQADGEVCKVVAETLCKKKYVPNTVNLNHLNLALKYGATTCV